ncbi:MAG: hypothetical protein RBU21_02790 [FCB group bacterium]|nr:hypothetical protein [FCB group bacterium]
MQEQEGSIAMSRQTPPLRLKMGFWVLLGMLSTAFAEVVAGATKFPFFEPWGILVVTPLYSLHILVLATILVRYRRLSWPGLLFAGALFGLYEGYLTKVLWYPEWAQNLAVAGEVRWLHVVLLVLWWHPLLAFIIPLLIGETTLTRSRSVLGTFSPKWRARLTGHTGRYALILALVCGMLASGNALLGLTALWSPLANGLFLLAVIALWRRTRGPQYTLAELLPGRTAFAVLVVALVGMYIVLGTYLLPDRLPGVMGHLLVLGLYAVFVYLLVRVPAATLSDDTEATVVSWRWLAMFVAVFSVTTLVVKVILGPMSIATLFPNWIAACTVGVFIYAMAAWRTLYATPTSRDLA